MKWISYISFFICFEAFSQLSRGSTSDYNQYYPISNDPSLLKMSDIHPDEEIIFEGNPNVRFSFYNNIAQGLVEDKNNMQALSLAVEPQIRMYRELSKPVKTPSYKILLSAQHMWRVNEVSNKVFNDRFITIALESGHYSNGQKGCAFDLDKGDRSSDCNAIYNSLNANSNLAEMLNRKNGNFSTNLTRLFFNYKYYNLSLSNGPKNMHSYQLGYILYHNEFLGILNWGALSHSDLSIYGKHRFLLSYEYEYFIKYLKNNRMNFRQDIQIIHGAHPFVNPYRSQSTITYYPFHFSKALGILLCFNVGHDNYNFRFLDAGTQTSFGLTWDQFPITKTRGRS